MECQWTKKLYCLLSVNELRSILFTFKKKLKSSLRLPIVLFILKLIRQPIITMSACCLMMNMSVSWHSVCSELSRHQSKVQVDCCFAVKQLSAAWGSSCHSCTWPIYYRILITWYYLLFCDFWGRVSVSPGLRCFVFALPWHHVTKYLEKLSDTLHC